jgi:hypothetical protein
LRVILSNAKRITYTNFTEMVQTISISKNESGLSIELKLLFGLVQAVHVKLDNSNYKFAIHETMQSGPCDAIIGRKKTPASTIFGILKHVKIMIILFPVWPPQGVSRASPTSNGG